MNVLCWMYQLFVDKKFLTFHLTDKSFAKSPTLSNLAE